MIFITKRHNYMENGATHDFEKTIQIEAESTHCRHFPL